MDGYQWFFNRRYPSLMHLVHWTVPLFFVILMLFYMKFFPLPSLLFQSDCWSIHILSLSCYPGLKSIVLTILSRHITKPILFSCLITFWSGFLSFFWIFTVQIRFPLFPSISFHLIFLNLDIICSSNEKVDIFFWNFFFLDSGNLADYFGGPSLLLFDFLKFLFRSGISFEDFRFLLCCFLLFFVVFIIPDKEDFVNTFFYLFSYFYLINCLLSYCI